MNNASPEWFTLTPQGVMRAFGQPEVDAVSRKLQVLLTGEQALDAMGWSQKSGIDASEMLEFETQGWVQRLLRPLQGPDARLDDFLQHVIASLSSERRVVLASDGGFCLGRAGIEQEEADVLSAAAADYAAFAARQARRGWAGASGYVAFHTDPEFLLPSYSFVPFWVDEAGYWLVILGEPLLNSPALVELLWGIKEAGTRFAVSG
ncbi:hypothetical protein [Rhodoferax sp.]|uniref:hypothetical protein n=1 Tax=Rhodoferax sp. TaxID=50421 RepID=UPI00262AA7EE|nr:hypothetical protein [Rhodoferax sp.]MDD2924960.1 hypothetical protein [Rhodoferax sp.]